LTLVVLLSVFGLFGNAAPASAAAGTRVEDLPHVVLETPIGAPPAGGQREAAFACGCFWGAEKGFWRLPGVVTTAVGYAGGSLAAPTYEQVCSGRSGHAEMVRVVWDDSRLHFSDLLKLFWECHDPTQGDRQGNDRGSQYRSAIFVDDPALIAEAEASRHAYGAQLQQAGYGAITTEIGRGQRFHYAEPYHQQYLAKPGSRPYCSAQPSGLRLESYPGADFLLSPAVWNAYDWSISHCVLRSDNTPIVLS
jgi:peptide-methionine (S)-S-oxide reductase